MDIIKHIITRYEGEPFDNSTVDAIQFDIAKLNIEGLDNVHLNWNRDLHQISINLEFSSPEYYTLYLLKNNG